MLIVFPPLRRANLKAFRVFHFQKLFLFQEVQTIEIDFTYDFQFITNISIL